MYQYSLYLICTQVTSGSIFKGAVAKQSNVYWGNNTWTPIQVTDGDLKALLEFNYLMRQSFRVT